MSFSYEVRTYDPATCRHGVVSVFGEEASRDAEAARLRTELGYETTCATREICDACRGCGSVRRGKTARAGFRECKACDGAGTWEVPCFRDRHGSIQAEFADGTTIQIHNGSGRTAGRFYAMKAVSVSCEAYQRAAMRAFLAGATARVRRDLDGILVADVAAA